MDRELDEKRGVIGHLIAKPGRETRSKLAHGGANTIRNTHRIRPG